MNGTICSSCSVIPHCIICANSETCTVCAQTYTLNTTTHKCTCPSGKYIDPKDNNCKPCEIGCLICTTKDDCSKCEDGYVLEKGACVKKKYIWRGV